MKPLPASVVMDVSVKVSGKVRKASESGQTTIDPRKPFDEFKIEVTEEIEDAHDNLVKDLTFKLAWKWEKRVLAQTANKKATTPWSRLAKEKHWDAVQKTIRESASKKNGLLNMVLLIQADFTPRRKLSGDAEEENVLLNHYT